MVEINNLNHHGSDRNPTIINLTCCMAYTYLSRNLRGSVAGGMHSSVSDTYWGNPVQRSTVAGSGHGPGSCRVGGLSCSFLTKKPDRYVNFLKESGHDKVALLFWGVKPGVFGHF